MPLTEPLTLRIRIGDENLPLRFKRLIQVMPKVGNLVIKEARKTLKQQDKVVSGALYESLRYNITTGKDTLQLTFDAGVASILLRDRAEDFGKSPSPSESLRNPVAAGR